MEVPKQRFNQATWERNPRDLENNITIGLKQGQADLMFYNPEAIFCITEENDKTIKIDFDDGKWEWPKDRIRLIV